jgi:rhodanese-related sulfurtransferase
MPTVRRSVLAASLISIMGLATGLHAQEPVQQPVQEQVHQDLAAPEMGQQSEALAVPAISSADLAADLTADANASKFLLIDVRSNAEFAVLNIAGSTNLPLRELSKDQLTQLNPGNKTLVFISNGFPCTRALQAANFAVQWGFTTASAFGDGIHAWTASNPKHTSFFGKPLERTATTPSTKLIPEAQFAAALATPSRAVELAAQGYKVYDIRDQADRKSFAINLPGTNRISIRDFVSLLARNHKSIPQSQIVIIDNDGTVARFAQYYLEQAQRTNYVFVKDGIRGWQSAGLDSTGQAVQMTASVPEPQ